MIDDGYSFPATVPVIENPIYIDDTLFGSDDIPELCETRNQLINLMKEERFQLRKWIANSPKLLDDILNNQYELVDHFLEG